MVLYVCAGELDILKFYNNSAFFSVSDFNLGAWSFVWGDKPNKDPIATGLIHITSSKVDVVEWLVSMPDMQVVLGSTFTIALA